jgi:hypothetical protein
MLNLFALQLTIDHFNMYGDAAAMRLMTPVVRRAGMVGRIPGLNAPCLTTACQPVHSSLSTWSYLASH